MKTLDSRGFRLGFAAFVLFTGLAGDFWRNSLSWYGYGAIVAVIVTISILLLVRNRTVIKFSSLPYPLLGFLVYATLSIAWSFYPLFTTLGAAVQWATTAAAVSIAITLSWGQLLTALGWAVRAILGLSFIFEFIVAVFVRHPIYPVWVTPDDPKHPAALLYWSRDLLFSTGKIQGIVGNSSLLAMIALIAVIVVGLQLATRSLNSFWSWFWMLVALATIVLTRSATIVVGLVAVGIVAAAVILIRRARSPRTRRRTYGGIGLTVVLLAVVAFILRTPLLHSLGKSSTLTGRVGIWEAVIGLAHERPAFGWGWLSYWIVWIEPFKNLIKRGGVEVPHAHDAWLDVWLQAGIVGLVLFGLLALSTLVRSWLMAKDAIISAPGDRGYHSWVSMLPLLVFVAQLIQSIVESRLLLEGGWILFVIWAVKTKLDPVAIDPVRGPK